MFLPNCIKLKSEEWLSVLAHRVVWLTLTEAPAWGGGEGSWWKWEHRRRQLFYVFSGNRAKNESIAGQTTSDFSGSNITPWLCQRGMIYDVRTKKNGVIAGVCTWVGWRVRGTQGTRASGFGVLPAFAEWTLPEWHALDFLPRSHFRLPRECCCSEEHSPGCNACYFCFDNHELERRKRQEVTEDFVWAAEFRCVSGEHVCNITLLGYFQG